MCLALPTSTCLANLHVMALKIKKSNFSEWFSEILQEAELSDLRYNVKGFIVYRPWAVVAIREMYRIYEKELEKKGHKPVILPSVIPEENFKMESEHVKGFVPEVLWITHGGDTQLEERLALRPTSETAMYKMYSIWIRSWKDLPLKLYQSCQVWRHETKATKPFIRGREFHWIETHNVFATEKEAAEQVREDMETTESIMHRVFGVPFIFMKRPEWDKFPGAVHTFAADTIMPDGKVLQQPSTHLLGQKFSKPFGIKFTDNKEKEQFGWQTCYGPCISRILASVVAIHGDDKGLVFPWDIAPLQVIIVPIFKEEKEKAEMNLYCEKLKERLSVYRVEIDKSENTPGWKFNQWEMKGVPLRIDVGPKEIREGRLTFSRRDSGEKVSVTEKNIESEIEKIGKSVTESLIKKADIFFKENIRSAKSMGQLESELNKGGLVKVNFCSTETGEKCAVEIKEKLHSDVRGTRADKKEKPEGNCIVCGKKATEVVYVGKSY